MKKNTILLLSYFIFTNLLLAQANKQSVYSFKNPDSTLLKIAQSGQLSREQAIFDIDALVYALNQVHPDMFSGCNQIDFFQEVNRIKNALSDSLSCIELYKLTAPIVAMLSDGHTNLTLPYNELFKQDTKHFPIIVDILSDKSILCKISMDSIIPCGSKILNINGRNCKQLIDHMLPFIAGETESFKLSRIDDLFPALHHILFPADTFNIVYLPQNSPKPLVVKSPGLILDKLKKLHSKLMINNSIEPYSFTIDSQNNVAILDFKQFIYPQQMKVFADSMFTILNNKRINNLIIDIRENMGGNSSVGDILLKYLSPEPFIQFDRTYIKITAFTQTLLPNKNIKPIIAFYEVPPTEYIKPLTIDNGHYQGNVYLLTSNKTFSSAGSFSWVFKECKMGKIIGEETGGMNVNYGDVLYYHLPISGLQCSISYKRFWQFRANENNIHGTIPDVSVPAQDAMHIAMKLIKEQQSIPH